MRESLRCLRSGLTLLEVIVSLAIFVGSLVAIGQLINLGSNLAVDTELKQQAAFLCRSKMAEFAAGILPLESVSDAPFEEAGYTNWYWSSLCEEDATLPGLWRVQVEVYRPKSYGGKTSVIMSKLIIDPLVRGSNIDPPPEDPEAAALEESAIVPEE